MNKSEILRSIRAERRATLALLRTLDPGLFEAPTALPGWRIREVVAHLITTDKASVTGTILPVALRSTDRLEVWNERQVPGWANRPIPDLLVGLDRWGRRFAAFVGAIPSPVYRLPLPSPWGRVGGLVIWVRAYDEWVHRQDIRRALRMPDEEVDLASIAEFLLTAIGQTSVRASHGGRGTISVSLEGTPLPEWRYDGAVQDGISNGPGVPSARVTAAAPAFIMAAAGRESFDALTARGALSIEGDEDLARSFLDRIRIV